MRQLSRISLRNILSILFREKHRIIIITLTALLGTSVWLAFQDSIYVAETHILVQAGKEKLSGIESYSKDSYNILFQERGQDIHNAIEILKDNQLAYAVLQQLRPLMQPEPPPQSWFKRLKYEAKALFRTVKDWLVEPLYWVGLRTRLSEEEMLLSALRGSLAVEAIEDTDVIRVNFGWTNPQFATLAVNLFSQEFLSRNIKVHENLQSEDFYREQISLHEKNLVDAETKLERARAEHHVTHLPLQKEILLKNISDEENRLNEATIRYEEYRMMKDYVVAASSRTNEWIPTPELRQRGSLDLNSLDHQYFELVSKRAQLSSNHTDSATEIRQITERMDKIRKQKADSLLSYFALNMRVSSQEVALIETTLRGKRAQLAELEQQTNPLTELERMRLVAEQNYLSYRKKAEELRVSKELSDRKISGIRIISEAREPAEPSSPKRGLILGLALAIGLFLGIGYCAVAEYFNHTFRDNDDVERILGIRLLMTIPKISAKQS
jgi:uncharacterized protein involved in exopolysaccharide biosynthesis